MQEVESWSEQDTIFRKWDGQMKPLNKVNEKACGPGVDSIVGVVDTTTGSLTLLP